MKYLKKIKTKKLLSTLTIITIISIIIGIFFIAILEKSNQELVKKSITTFFKNISNNNLNYQQALTSSITSNLLVNIIIWLLGISIIGIPIVIIILLIKSFILGFSFTSIIYTYNIKGILPSIIYIIPHIINLFITFILVYYSISFSLLLWNYLFRKKEYNRTVITKRYLKLLLISTIALIVSSLIEIFLIPMLLQLF